MIPSNLIKAGIYRALKACKGSRYHRHLRWFLTHQFDTVAEWRPVQEALLGTLLKGASSRIEGYRERLGALDNVSDTQWSLYLSESVPLLTRKALVTGSQRFFDEHANSKKLMVINTGGSTGTPLQVRQDYAFRDWLHAATGLYYHWTGLCMGKPYFLLWAAPQDFYDQLSSWRSQLLLGVIQGRRILNCRLISPETLTSFIHRINAQPDCQYMVGYANELYTLALHSRENNLPVRRPFKAIYATAEMLSPAMREIIEAVFDAPVLNRYGSREIGDIACECLFQQGLHINPLYTYVEIVDDDGYPLPPGQEGQIVITTLHNHVMPLIRYAIGDTGVLKPLERCLCGRTWPTLQYLGGRVTEKLYLPNGRRFGGASLYTAFESLPALKRYQIVQLASDKLHLRIDSWENNYVERFQSSLEALATQLNDWAGCRLDVTFEQTSAFDKTPTGKVLLVVHPGANAAGLSMSRTALGLPSWE